jgi:hypothetical protein
MLSISQDLQQAKAMISLHDSKFDDSQRLRMEAILALKCAGDALIKIRSALKDATKTNPIETDLGVFRSFNHFLDEGFKDMKRTYCYKCIKLAENWDIVLKLGMQDCSDSKSLSKSMRLSRTLRIIDWYLEQTAASRPEEELTIDQYWLEQDQQQTHAGLTKRQLQLELEKAQVLIEQLLTENANLKSKLRQPV